MIFSNLIGNDSVKQNLIDALSSEYFSSTLLFYGPGGVGKSLFAKQIAKQLMYDKISVSEEKRIDEENHPDFYLIRPEGKLHTIEALRKMIKEVYKPPFEARCKVFIIDDADKMLDSSSNAILKTLEEPNLDNYLILITDHIDGILPTIRSRCMPVRFSPIEDFLIEKYLIDHSDKSEATAKYICKLSQGSLGMAISLSKEPNFEENLSLLLDILSRKKDPSELCHMEELCMKEYVFSFILMWFRDMHVKKYDPDQNHLFFRETALIDMKVPSLETIFFILKKAKKGIFRNVRPSVCLENFFNEVFQTNLVLS